VALVLNENCGIHVHTRVDEASGRAFTELLRLERQRDFDDSGDVSGRSVDLDGVRRDQLTTASTYI